MRLTHLKLKNFRNIESLNLDIDEGLTCIVGRNAQGKTNILESVFFLLTGKGIKEDRQEELLKFGTAEAFVEGLLKNDDTELLARIHLRRNEKVEKVFQLNKIRKMLFTYTREMPPCVLFSPSLISIIDGQPSERRHFVDGILAKVDMEYKKRLHNYEQGLRRRNRVIEKAESPDFLQSELQFWDDYLIEHAQYLVEKRRSFIDEINANTISDLTFTCEYTENPISRKSLDDSFMKQFYQKRTLVGPQRDEFRLFFHKNGDLIDVDRYCSRGEQRLALFWLILQQLYIFTSQIDQKPILLLDDIFSELDLPNKHLIAAHISQYQTILTTTEEELIEKEKLKGRIITI